MSRNTPSSFALSAVAALALAGPVHAQASEPTEPLAPSTNTSAPAQGKTDAMVNWEKANAKLQYIWYGDRLQEINKTLLEKTARWDKAVQDCKAIGVDPETVPEMAQFKAAMKRLKDQNNEFQAKADDILKAFSEKEAENEKKRFLGGRDPENKVPGDDAAEVFKTAKVPPMDDVYARLGGIDRNGERVRQGLAIVLGAGALVAVGAGLVTAHKRKKRREDALNGRLDEVKKVAVAGAEKIIADATADMNDERATTAATIDELNGKLTVANGEINKLNGQLQAAKSNPSSVAQAEPEPTQAETDMAVAEDLPGARTVPEPTAVPAAEPTEQAKAELEIVVAQVEDVLGGSNSVATATTAAPMALPSDASDGLRGHQQVQYIDRTSIPGLTPAQPAAPAPQIHGRNPDHIYHQAEPGLVGDTSDLPPDFLDRVDAARNVTPQAPVAPAAPATDAGDEFGSMVSDLNQTAGQPAAQEPEEGENASEPATVPAGASAIDDAQAQEDAQDAALLKGAQVDEGGRATFQAKLLDCFRLLPSSLALEMPVRGGRALAWTIDGNAMWAKDATPCEKYQLIGQGNWRSAYVCSIDPEAPVNLKELERVAARIEDRCTMETGQLDSVTLLDQIRLIREKLPKS